MRTSRILSGLVLAAALSGTAVVGTRAQIPGESWQRIGLIGAPVTAAATSPGYDGDGTLFAGVSESGLWRSTDRGQTWIHLAGVPNNATVTAIVFNPDYEFGQGKTLFVGTSAGIVYSSINDFASANSRKTLTDPRSGAPAPVRGGTLRAANELFWATSGGIWWRNPSTGTYSNLSLEVPDTYDCRAVAANEATGKVLAACFNTKNGPVFEWGGGQVWAARGPAALSGQVPTALHISVSDPNVCFLGTAANGLWRSTDRGTTWGVGCDGSTQAVAFSVGAVAGCPDLANDKEVWEGRSDGLRISTDVGATCVWDGIGGAITSIAFNSRYHRGGRCDVFVGTTAGLFLKSCEPAPPPPTTTPTAVSVDELALSREGPAGTWAAGSLGLLRNSKVLQFLEYNASGAFGGGKPNVVALCVPTSYRSKGACGTDEQTVFLAERALGVFRSRDDGNSWTQLSSGWPAGVTVNDLAIAPNYVTGSPYKEVLYAGTSAGLYRWDYNGTSFAWIQTNQEFSTLNVTRVVVPASYERGGPTGLPFRMVVLANDNYIDPKTGQPVALFYSDNDGGRFIPFTNVPHRDIVRIGFAPDYLVGGPRQLFYASPSGGMFFTSYAPESNIPWCAFSSGLPKGFRDADVAPEMVDGLLRFVVATDVGPYYGLFSPDNTSDDCANLKYYEWRLSTFERPPSTCMDTLSVRFAFLGDGRVAALGTSQDGVYFSPDGGSSFKDPGTGYTSLPNDVWITLPYARNPNLLFATSPTYGAFVSRDKGTSFRPFNGGGCTGLNEGAKGFANGYQRAGSVDYPEWDLVFAGATTAGRGLYYRWLQESPTGTYNLDTWSWTQTNVSTGAFQKITNMTNGNLTEPIWASSDAEGSHAALGQYKCPSGTWLDFTAFNGGLPSYNASSNRFGVTGVPTVVALSDGVAVSDTVGLGVWKYYSFVVPSGAAHLNATLNGLPAGSYAHLYLRYQALPSSTLYDYRSILPGQTTDVVNVYPTSSPQPLTAGVWYIGVYGYGTSSNSFTITAALLASLLDVPGAPAEGDVVEDALPEASRSSSLPDPLAPAGGAIWGTVSLTGTGGVYRATDTAAFAAPAPEVVTWEERNGVSPTNLDISRVTQSVIQLSDGTLLAGQDGALWLSPTPDEGRTTWFDVSARPQVGGTSLDVRDFLESANGDALVAINGAAGEGGVWLSGSRGNYWMNLSEGFDAATQTLEMLTRDQTATDEERYYSGTDTTGSYSRTITEQIYPTLTSVSPSSGLPTAGGTLLTLTGTGFSAVCPTGDTSDCPYAGVTVLFDDAHPPVDATYVSGTQVTVTTPPHPTGPCSVRVMNRDTRWTGTYAVSFTCVAPTGAPSVNNAAADLGCADSGVQITWNADPGGSAANWNDGGGGTRTYEVLRNSNLIVSALAYGTVSYTDTTGTNGTTYTYQVRYRSGCNLTTITTGASAADYVTPGTPSITSITDNNAYVLDGVRITFSAGSGATNHELWRDGAKVLDSYASGTLYAPGDAGGHSYVVRAVNGSCVSDSNSMAGTDQRLVPPEIPSDSFKWTSKTTLTWTVIAGVPGYHVYRGLQPPSALQTSAKVCLDNGDWVAPPASVREGEPASGEFFWYLVTGHNDLGADGSAGSGRTLASTGDCP